MVWCGAGKREKSVVSLKAISYRLDVVEWVMIGRLVDGVVAGGRIDITKVT